MRLCPAIALALLAACATSASAQTFIGPTAYFGLEDSPFRNAIGTPGFHFENFESLVPENPGFSIDHGHIRGPGQHTDSVDSDDGRINGLGRRGHSWYFARGRKGVTISFDQESLGSLPTFAGIVWTDGSRKARITFEAFDSEGHQILKELVRPLGIKRPRGGTVEDQLLAATYESGIASIRITSSRGGIELDHLQFGGTPVPVPEPASLALLSLAGLLLGRRCRG